MRHWTGQTLRKKYSLSCKKTLDFRSYLIDLKLVVVVLVQPIAQFFALLKTVATLIQVWA